MTTAERNVDGAGAEGASPLTLTAAERGILDTLRRKADSSRTEIAARLKLSPAMLTKAMSHFAAAGLVSERRDRSGALGQPALRLALRRGAVAGIGLDVSTEGVKAAAMDLGGEVLDRWEADVPGDRADLAADAAARAVERLAASAKHVAGIGVWLPGLLGPDGSVLEVTPTQRGVDYAALCERLAERTSLPVHLESKPAAIGEAMRPGGSDGVEFMLFLSYGIGGSVIEGMRLFRGGFGEAGNVGTLMPDGRPRPSLVDLADHLGLPIRAIDDREIGDRLDRADPALAEWIETRGAALSHPMSVVVQLFNPTAIVFGGLLPRRLLERLIERVDATELDFPGRQPLTPPQMRVAAVVGPDSIAASAAAVPLARLLAPEMV